MSQPRARPGATPRGRTMASDNPSPGTSPHVFCEGAGVYLRPARLSDAARIAAWKRDPVVQRMALGPDVDPSLAEQERQLARAVGSDRELYLILVLAEPDRPLGYVRLDWMDGGHRVGWLRFALGEQRGKGHAAAALAPLLDRLFREGMHRADAEVYAFNEASLRLLRRLGFRQEGVRRQAHFTGEGYADVVVLGLLAEDFTAPAAGP